MFSVSVAIQCNGQLYMVTKKDQVEKKHNWK